VLETGEPVSGSRLRSSTKRNMYEALAIGLALTALSYGVGLWAGWVSELNWLEVFAVFTSYASTYLCVVERRFNYVFGSVSSAAYAVLFWQQDLVASAVLNAYLAPTLIYGWLRWGKDARTRAIRHLQVRWLPVYLAVTAGVYFGAVWVVEALGGHFAGWDVAILVGTIAAQLLLDNKVIETWWVWLAVNTSAIYVYFSSGLTLVGFQYIFFWANCLWAWWVWKGAKNRQEVVA